ncbi:hypothetical protein HYPSUDRAFT_210255 [Hypholoma sublateritium FD-334 SS-4]|uniref:Uncharacterized protein n=1 Tax=Hypholoma sublateritium (strain FD-334 SS-4) TaxID=945553 RepID=A0A0D2LPG0_HYPSF|nr:hypothetical protein HYPSUDRAFT_210255 [Hypholoma sublateritium FD-334 SS-4]
MLLEDLAPRQSTFGRASGALTPVFKRLLEDELERSGLRAPSSGEREGSDKHEQHGRQEEGMEAEYEYDTPFRLSLPGVWDAKQRGISWFTRAPAPRSSSSNASSSTMSRMHLRS